MGTMYYCTATKLIHVAPIPAYHEDVQGIKLYMREFHDGIETVVFQTTDWGDRATDTIWLGRLHRFPVSAQTAWETKGRVLLSAVSKILRPQ